MGTPIRCRNPRLSKRTRMACIVHWRGSWNQPWAFRDSPIAARWTVGGRANWRASTPQVLLESQTQPAETLAWLPLAELAKMELCPRGPQRDCQGPNAPFSTPRSPPTNPTSPPENPRTCSARRVPPDTTLRGPRSRALAKSCSCESGRFRLRWLLCYQTPSCRPRGKCVNGGACAAPVEPPTLRLPTSTTFCKPPRTQA
mmetsp:Transcript_85638/g.239210  ORF Transcript_85638/g.239210 Transcript_85638/m.239210 type:complete len:200 (-) Transcript_85638:3-602(-)